MATGETDGESTRRDFLAGRSAADALANLAQRAADGLQGQSAVASAPSRTPVGESGGRSSRPYLIRLRRQAMACQFEVLLNAGQYPAGSAAARNALDRVDELEAQLSVYREDSELSLLNRRAATAAIPIEPRLFDLLAAAQVHWRETDGAFDITAGPLSRTWGFFRRQGRVPDQDELLSALESVGMRHVLLDAAHRSVRFAKPGVELNLGAIGKGYALDRAAELLSDCGIEDFLLHGGRSSVLARGGNAAGDTTEGGWTVSLEDPLRPGRTLAEFRLRDAALGTSGTAAQFFRHGGRRYGHILDPRSGQPAEGMFSATVVAPTAAEADALSTAFYVLGPELSAEYCGRHPAIAALLVAASPDRDSASVTACNFAEGALRLL